LKEDTDTYLTGFSPPAPAISFHVSTAKDFQYISFTRGDGFKQGLENPLKLEDGRTIGEEKRAAMHEKLDAWMEENLK
jgi:hypothetical protein